MEYHKLANQVLEEINSLFDIQKLKYELEELDMKLSDSGIWDQPEIAQGLLKKQKFLTTELELYNSFEKQSNELLELCSMHTEIVDEDFEYAKEIESEMESLAALLSKEFDKKKLSSKLTGEYDSLSCIFSIHAGTGGTDAQDWAQMLFRMYKRHAEKKGYTLTVLDVQDGEEAGIKSASIQIDGTNAYGFLKSEKGVHRLVRISPFNANGKRQTSFASVDVMPQLEDISGIEIKESNLKIDTYRSQGAGGQHVNTTDSAVRITHIPTGVVVACQNERSQIQNRATAMKMLVAKLLEIKEREHKDKISDIAGDYSQIAWGSQIRSYVFHPYNLVKDHRTGAETANLGAVMDGDIDLFVDAYLTQR